MSEKTMLTPEQAAELVEVFRENDFTSDMSLRQENHFEGKAAEIFMNAKKQFGEYWLGNLPALGIKREMKNFSKNHPVNFLENADADYISKAATGLYGDGDLTEALEMMFAIYAEPIEKGLTAYACKLRKSVDELTEKERNFVIEKVAELAGEVGTNVIMQGQQVPELFGISKSVPQHEDFSRKHSTDKANFIDSWRHYRTKLGAPLNFSELSKDEVSGIENAKSFFDHSDTEKQHEYETLRNAFADTLSSTDREIYLMREKGYTQAEIASYLGYKTHSAVTKRLTAMRKQFDDFCTELEASAE